MRKIYKGLITFGSIILRYVHDVYVQA